MAFDFANSTKVQDVHAHHYLNLLKHFYELNIHYPDVDHVIQFNIWKPRRVLMYKLPTET